MGLLAIAIGVRSPASRPIGLTRPVSSPAVPWMDPESPLADDELT
jgi:hypothetical protein